MTDPQALAERALNLGSGPVPKYADLVSRRKGVLQYELHEWQRRRREAQRAFTLASVRVAAVEAELAALERGDDAG